GACAQGEVVARVQDLLLGRAPADRTAHSAAYAAGQILGHAARARLHQPALEVVQGISAAICTAVPFGHLAPPDLVPTVEHTSTNGGHMAPRWRGSGRR